MTEALTRRIVLPDHSMLSDDDWRARHHIVRAGLILLLVVDALVGVFTEVDGGLAHLAIDFVPMLGGVAFEVRLRRRVMRHWVTSIGLLLGCGLMVHLTGGLIEAHFSYFVVLPLIALYSDWRLFVFSVLFVAVSHAVGGQLDPTSMYNHVAATTNPGKWALVHAAFVLALTGVMLAYWNRSDRQRLALVAALDELRVAQRRLVQAQKLESIGQLAAGIAHEINTPIQFVGDNLRFIESVMDDLVPDGEGPDETDADDADFIRRELPLAVTQSLAGIGTISRIVGAMRGFSRVDEASGPNDLNDLVRDTVVVARSAWRDRAEVTLDLDESLARVVCPPGAMSQVILNLIVNAADAVEARHGRDGAGSIVLGTRRDGSDALLTVSDNGVGVTDEIRDRMFDHFFTTKPVGSGTGQGLSLVYETVTSCGGTIDVRSEVGVGTTFEVRLPTQALVGLDRGRVVRSGR